VAEFVYILHVYYIWRYTCVYIPFIAGVVTSVYILSSVLLDKMVACSIIFTLYYCDIL